MQVPGCKIEGNHLKGDITSCTLVSVFRICNSYISGEGGMLDLRMLTSQQEAFKTIIDKYTSKNWKQACASNLDGPAFPEKVEPVGY